MAIFVVNVSKPPLVMRRESLEQYPFLGETLRGNIFKKYILL